MLHFFYWFWHSFTKCPTHSLEHTMYGTSHCRACGRVFFVSDSLPKMHHISTSSRNRYN